MRKGFLWFAFLFFLAGCQSNQPFSSETVREKPATVTSNHSRDPVIVAFGDSLTAGSGVAQEQSYPSQLQRLLDQANYSYRIVNAGIGGNTTADGLSRLQSIIALNPRLVILELGANDGLRGLPIAAVRKNLETLIERLQAAAIPIIMAGMYIPPNYGPDYSEQFHQMYLDLAKEYHLRLIPFFLENVAGHPDLNLEDGIHPTGQGYRVVAQTVFEAIKPLL
jgi:acyl-CoA thioesterase-1